MKRYITFALLLLIALMLILSACSDANKPLVEQCLNAYEDLRSTKAGHITVQWTGQINEKTYDWDQFSYECWFRDGDRIYSYFNDDMPYQSVKVGTEQFTKHKKDGTWITDSNIMDYTFPWNLDVGGELVLDFESKDTADNKTKITCKSSYDFVAPLTANPDNKPKNTWLTFTFDENGKLTELFIRGQYQNTYNPDAVGEDIYMNITVTFHTFDEAAVDAEFDRVYKEVTKNE